MKDRSSKKLITDYNISTLRHNVKAREDLRSFLTPKERQKNHPPLESLMFRPVRVRKNMLYPPSEVQKELLCRHPVICEQDFLSILEVLRNTAGMFEKTPGIFSIHSTEELRNIITSTLNVSFSDRPGEEIFLNHGRSGFNLHTEHRDILLGKCVLWKCAVGINCCIDSLLRKVNCPACKAVLIIFNKSEHSRERIMAETRDTLENHPAVTRFEKTGDSGWNALLHVPDNPQLITYLHIFFINLFTGKKKSTQYLDRNEREFFAGL